MLHAGQRLTQITRHFWNSALSIVSVTASIHGACFGGRRGHRQREHARSKERAASGCHCHLLGAAVSHP